MNEVSVGLTAGAVECSCGPVTPYVESWRVVAAGTARHDTVTDAAIRVRFGDRRLIANGEAEDVASALDDAVRSAVKLICGYNQSLSLDLYHHLRAQCRGEGSNEGRDDPVSRLAVAAVHQDGLLGRIAVLLNAHEVTSFSYDAQADGRARIAVDVQGGQWHVERVASKLRRVVGVLTVAEV